MSESFHEAYCDLWVDIARNIADEKRPTPKTETDKAAIVDKLVAEVVKARLALSGVTDPAQVAAVAKRVTVSESGDLVGLDADGRPGVGSGPNYTLSLDDIASDIGATAQAETSSQGKNPFRPGADFNLTAQMVMLKNDPERAEHFQYLASIGK